jgi:hypothetical protein
MLLFVVTASSARSVWMPWELGFFDAARGRIAVYPVDAAAERAAKRQQYLSLYTVLRAGSLEREIAAAQRGAAQRGAARKAAARKGPAIDALRRTAIDNIFGDSDFRGSVEIGRRIADVWRSPTNVGRVRQLQSDQSRALRHVWQGIFDGKR